MLLTNVRLVPGKELVDITVTGEIISAVTAPDNNKKEPGLILDFHNAIAFPGLINSHEHLDFNCFPALGNKMYENYTAWGADIHKRYKAEINAVLKIPLALRTAWGIYKNLLAGVTTVVNHGNKLKIDNPLITTRQESQNLHSVGFQKNWKWKLNNPLKTNQLCVIHIGEGTDEKAADEIDELIKWNLLKRNIVGIHAVAMSRQQANHFKAIVWCPESNRFLLDAMADIKNLHQATTVLFGTDSTLTGSWNIWQQLRLARQTQQVTDEQLFRMVSSSAAETWGINTGEIVPGKQADIVIAKTGNGVYQWDHFYNINPEDILLVMHQGEIILFDHSLADQLKPATFNPEAYTPVMIEGQIKYVRGNIPSLMNAIHKYYPAAVFPCTNATNVYEDTLFTDTSNIYN